MARAHRTYGDRVSTDLAVHIGHDSAVPTAGHYRHRLRSGAPLVGVRIWHGPPADPVTGDLLDRAHRWQAEVNGTFHDVERLWPGCGREPISADDYRHLCRVAAWARDHTPDAPLADPTRRVDPLTSPLLI